MNTLRALLPSLGAGLLFTLGGSGEKLAFQPRADSSVTKSFDLDLDLSLDEFSLLVNGQDVGGMVGDLDMSMKMANRIEVTDTYKAVSSGRPTDLLRSFEALASTMTMEITPSPAEIPEVQSSSELEGRTVAFHWNEDTGEYERSFAGDEGDAELLEGLDEDMDLRTFLPDGEVSKDQSWTVELARLAVLVMPGGDLRLEAEGAETDEESMKKIEELFGGLGQEFADQLEGECKCTYKGVHDEDGVSVGEIAIDFQVATTLDLSTFLEAAIREGIEKSGAGDMFEFSLDSADLSVDFEGTGTLLWNMGAGRMQSFHLGGDVTFGMDLTVSVEAEGESQSLDASLELSGSVHQSVATRE